MKQRFEYFILSLWMGVFVGVILHLSHHGSDKLADWALNAFSALLGALLGLIQGQRMAQRASDSNKKEGTNGS